MTQVQDTSELGKASGPDNHLRLEAAIAAWKSSVSDAHASLTSRLLQTHELLDCLVKAFAERQDKSNAAIAAWTQVEDLRAEIAERDHALAAATALTTEQARRLDELETELQAALARETAAALSPDTPVNLAPVILPDTSAQELELEQARQELAALREELQAAHAREAAAALAADIPVQPAPVEPADTSAQELELKHARQALAALREELELERRTASSEAQQQAQWKNELAQDLAAEARARAVLEDECEELRADIEMLRRANESLSHEVSASRPGGRTTYPFRIYDESGQKRRLGEMLVDAGYLTPTQLGDALVEQESIRETRLGAILVNKGLVREDVVAEGIALQEAS